VKGTRKSLKINSNMDLRSYMNAMGGMGVGGSMNVDAPMNDNAEMVYISSLSLLKVRIDCSSSYGQLVY
jgi:hypothetical protein